MTPYQKHKQKWCNCQKCELHRRRHRVVLGRGALPAKVLFVGEAPGASEDVIGKPFVGPAGKLLDHVIREAAFPAATSYAITNLVACIPLDEEGEKTAEPPKDCVKTCAVRLGEFAGLCCPSLVVYVGKLSAKHGPKTLGNVRSVKLIHPAAILRMDVSQKGLAIQRSIVTLRDAAEEL